MSDLLQKSKSAYPGLFSGGVYYYRYINTKLIRLKKIYLIKMTFTGVAHPLHSSPEEF